MSSRGDLQTAPVAMADVLARVTEGLIPVGWRRRAGAIYTAEVDEGLHGWLGLNHAVVRGRGVRLNPVVGVRHATVEGLVSYYRNERVHPYIPPTISRPLVSLLPSFRDFVFVSQVELATVAEELVQVIAHAGRDYINDSATLAQIAARIDAGDGHLLEYRRPIVLAMLGNKRDAVADLVTSVQAHAGRHDRAAEQFRAFAEAFLANPPDG